MKALVCEMCNSNNLVKQDVFFVCQNCGTKYSVEEARKMMIDGTVDVSGSTVKVDNTASIENYYKMALNAYDSSNQTEAESYCNKIIEIDPKNSKAWFLKGQAAGWQSTLANIRLEESVNCFTNAVNYAEDAEKEQIKKKSSKEIEKLSTALMNLSCERLEDYPSKDNADRILKNLKLTQLYSLALLAKCGVSADGFKKEIATRLNNACVSAWQDHILPDYSENQHPYKHTWERFIERVFAIIEITEAAIDLCDDDDKEDIQRYKNLIFLRQQAIDSCSWKYGEYGYTREYSLTKEAKETNIDLIMEYHKKIKEIDPNYQIPERPTAKQNGCYVATCVYGSYDCPQVWTLRRYRDYQLAETWYGRAFIKIYYTISPTLVKWFGDTNWFKNMWRGTLDRMVSNLQAEGVDDTPYIDKEW